MENEYKLYPIGFGSGLNGDFRINSWYMKIGDRLYLFDCPYSTVSYFASKEGKKILTGIKRVVVFISHLHEEICGGISNLSWLIGRKYKKEIWVFVHTKIAMAFTNYLEITQCDLVNITVTQGDYYQDEEVQVLCRPSQHSGIAAFSFVIYGKYKFIEGDGENWCIYYSSDNKNFMDEVMVDSFLKDPESKLIYHEITFNANNDEHCYKDKIIKVIPKSLRKYITPINLDLKGDIKRCSSLGFNIPDEFIQ